MYFITQGEVMKFVFIVFISFLLNSSLSLAENLPLDCFTFSEVHDGYAITSGNCFPEDHRLVLPSKYRDKFITEIGWGAFRNTRYKSVIFPSNLKRIQGSAFVESGLEKVEIPDSVEYIGALAFAGGYGYTGPGNGKISSVRIGKNVTHIEKYAFQDNIIKSLSLNDKLEYIGEEAFRRNKISTPIKLPNSLTHLGDAAFAINEIESVHLPDSLEVLSSRIFQFNKIKKLKLGSRTKSIGLAAFHHNLLTNISIPENVEIIKGHAFGENSLTSLEIPNSVKKIGYFSFSENQLKDLVIPGNVQKIELGAFANNKIKDLVLEDGIKLIEYQAFYKNRVSKVVIPDSIEKMEQGAFDPNVILVGWPR